MKIKRILKLLACIISISTFTACGNNYLNNKANDSNTKVAEKGYLKYCGEQKLSDERGGNKYIEIYEDAIHNKIVYVGTNDQQNQLITISVSDKSKGN